MDYAVVVSPELGLSAEEVVAAWNEAPECQELAEAQLVTGQAESFAPTPEIVQQGLILLAGAAGGLALEAFKDVVKEKLTELFRRTLTQEQEPALQVDAVRQPGGAYLLVVRKR